MIPIGFFPLLSQTPPFSEYMTSRRLLWSSKHMMNVVALGDLLIFLIVEVSFSFLAILFIYLSTDADFTGHVFI